MALEVALASLVFVLAVIGVAAAGVWTYHDASARGAGAIAPLWGLGVVGFIPLGLFYVHFRSHIGERATPPRGRETALAVTAIGSIFAAVLAPLVSPPDPVTMGWYALGLWPVGIFVGYGIVFRDRLPPRS